MYIEQLPSPRIVLLNGPPGSGKDTLARLVARAVPGVARLGFADHLKRATHAAYGMPTHPYDAFEHVKDAPSQHFFGLTPRQAYIEHAERYMKPLHGRNVYGLLWVRAMNHLLVAPQDGPDGPVRLVFVTDAGFDEEIDPVISHVGAENVSLVRLHREGKDFSGDTRSYLSMPNPSVRVCDIVNVPNAPAIMARQMLSWLIGTGALSIHAGMAGLNRAGFGIERDASWGGDP